MEGGAATRWAAGDSSRIERALIQKCQSAAELSADVRSPRLVHSGVVVFSLSGATNACLSLALLSRASIAFRSRRPTDQVFRGDHHGELARGAGVFEEEAQAGPRKELSGYLGAGGSGLHEGQRGPHRGHDGRACIFSSSGNKPSAEGDYAIGAAGECL